MDIKLMTKGIHDCACGKDHNCPIDFVEIGSGVLPRIVDICQGYGRIVLVADQNTWRVCGEEVAKLLGEQVEDTIVFQTGDKPLIPDEEALAAIEAKVTKATDLIVGVGSGVINDLCKRISFAAGLPYYIVATAPSMDGYASVGSALILKGMKVTLNARPPKAILADTKVLKDAPMDMLQAGFGDIVGKYSCLNDWKLSALVNGEYFCQQVYDIVYDTAMQVEKLAQGVKERDEQAVCALMDALVAVGIAMAYVGNSRPASGSEHHLSHFFEITGILDDVPYFSHGIDVIYSAVATAKVRQQVLASQPHPYSHDQAAWDKAIEGIYSTSAEEVKKLQGKLNWYNTASFENVAAKWEAIKSVLAEAPGEEKMLQMVESVGLDYAEFVKLYGQEKIDTAILYAKDLKDRYSVLWLNYMFCR